MKLRLDSGLLCVTWWSLLVPAFSGKRTWWPVPLGEWMAGSLCSWLMPVLLWRSVHCGEVGVFWMILREWSQPPAIETCWSECNVLTATLKIFWWLLPVGDSGLRCRLSWLLGIRKLIGFWSDVLSSILNSMLTSFLQVQRPCIEPVQTLCSLVFQANVLFSQIILMLLQVLHFQILYSISVLKLFRVSDCYECLNLKVEQLIENRNIARFISEKVMWLLLVINY